MTDIVFAIPILAVAVFWLIAFRRYRAGKGGAFITSMFWWWKQ
ncbi:hypothetical protein ED21_23183 [Erythrobacter sp. SD-21]|nr:hypothetical protein ED21_23183 [Erythrobacter sp. SD-21]